MSDPAQDLVDQMAEAGGWPEPALLEAILERGDEAVSPLLEILHQDVVQDGPEETPVYLAVGLLRDLHARSAIPDLVEQFRRYDDEVLEEVADTLASFKAEVIEPVLAIARDRSLGSYPRRLATETAKRAAGNDPALRARVAEVIRELLADCLARAEDPEEDDVDIVSDFVIDLAELADPLAHDLIHAAYQADLVDTFFAGDEKSLKADYEHGGEWHPTELPAFLQSYRKQFEKHLEHERRRREAPESPPLIYPSRDEYVPPPPITAPIRHAEKKPGRNDPCRCGSGKKYKKCHLSLDQA